MTDELREPLTIVVPPEVDEAVRAGTFPEIDDEEERDG